MRIAIIGDPKRKKEDEPLIEEAKSSFDEVVYVPIDQVRFDISKKSRPKGMSVRFGSFDLSEFDYILPIPTTTHSELFYTLLWMLEDSRKPFSADQYMLFMNSELLRNRLRSKKVNMRGFVSVASNVSLDNIKGGLKFPLIVRPPKKRVKVTNLNTLKEVVSLYKFGTPILIEKPIGADMDTWVFVAGNEAIASYKSYQRRPKIRQPSVTGSHLDRIAVKICKLLGCEYCAIRFLLTNDQWIVDKISISPGFANFQKVTGVNVARHIISNAAGKRARVEKLWFEKVEEFVRKNIPMLSR